MINCFRGKYFFLSNFYPAKVCYEGLMYKSAEAAFQAAKTLDNDTRIAFTKFNASIAKKEGRKIPLRKDWEEIKFKVMYDIVKDKFSRNKKLKSLLVQTGNEYLQEENTWGDRIWGTCNGYGQNMLGHILMQVRNELK